jgi:hypothetical protein
MKMVELFDRSEFIVTDGSGSSYEAVSRGCKGLTLRGLRYQSGKDIFEAPLECGALPPTNVEDYRSHLGLESDREWLMRWHGPTLREASSVNERVREEILNVYGSWADREE